MPDPLLHLITPDAWRAALTAGALPRERSFVHLSTPEQVALPANRIFPGRTDLLVLAVDPAGLDVRWEPGLPSDPPGLRFPHAYGGVPTAAVVAVLPYRPGPGGRFGPPPPAPRRADVAVRGGGVEASLLRRTATAEIPVTGGVAVVTAPVPDSHQHNQLLLDGPATPEAVGEDAARTGLPRAVLRGPHAAALAAALRGHGWESARVVLMVASPGGPGTDRVESVPVDALRGLWNAGWRRTLPDVDEQVLAQLTDRYLLEARRVDLRALTVFDDGRPVAACLLKIDGGTALLDAVGTEPAYRGRGHGDALLAHARALAADAGCDLLTLDADAGDRPRHWYARRGFVETGEAWTVRRR